MTEIDELRTEHEAIRAELALLDDMLPSVHAAPSLALHILDTIARALRHQGILEERLVTAAEAGWRRIPFDVTQHMREARDNQRIRLAVLHELLADRPPGYASDVVTQTRELLAQVRTDLIAEEAWLSVMDGSPHELAGVCP